jgi:hypothetical protein
MVKWTEVDAYSGMPVKEDAPTNFAGAGSKVAMPPDAMMKKKKKKTFLDARTKEYKEHQKRLEAARQRREERRKQAAKINEGQLDEREKGIDKLPRQFLNPDKEVMILKKGRVIVIDKKDQDKYMRQGWELAEEEMMEVNVTFIKKFAADMKKDKQFKPYADKFMKLAMKGGSPRDALEKSVPDFISGKDIEKLISKNRMSAVFGEEKPKTFTQKVQEQIGGFAREAFLAENNMDVIKSIVKSKGAKDIKMKDGKLKMDAFTASAIAQVYDKVNPANKKKMEALANGKKSDLMKLQALAMKFVK